MDIIEPARVTFESVPAELGAEINHLPAVFGIRIINRVAIDGPATYHRQFRNFLWFHAHPSGVRDASILLLFVYIFMPIMPKSEIIYIEGYIDLSSTL